MLLTCHILETAKNIYSDPCYCWISNFAMTDLSIHFLENFVNNIRSVKSIFFEKA